MADFTGFYFNNVHSSTFGILRVSDGDRYIHNLLPDFEDYDTEIPMGGSIYHGRVLKKTEFEIKIAFDSMTEQQLRNMTQWLSEKELKPFRFDERPYKTYWAKIAKKPELEYICFMEQDEDYLLGEKKRVYKGEGTLNFICYNPIAYCIDESYDFINGQYVENKEGINWQDLDSYNYDNLKTQNVLEWARESGLKKDPTINRNFLKQDGVEDGLGVVMSSYRVPLFNPGDMPTDYQLFIDWSQSYSSQGQIDLNKQVNNSNIYIDLLTSDGSRENMPSLVFNTSDLKYKDAVLIDSKKHAIVFYRRQNNGIFIPEMRYDTLQTSNNTANMTPWFKIPQGESILQFRYYGEGFINENNKPKGLFIKYNYKYY